METEINELTIKQTMERLGVTRQRVHDLLNDKTLSSRVVLEGARGKRLIPEAEVEALRLERQAQAGAEKKGKGRPPKVQGE